MAYLFGEHIQLGMGVESTRGTGVAPQAWIPARTPTGIVAVVDKVQVKETRNSGISSQGSETVQTRAEGDLEFNVRNTSIGWILKSLLGDVNSVAASGATTHTFTRQTSGVQHPSLTLALAQTGFQDYEYPLAVVSSVEFRTPVDDLVNATANFIATGENTHSNFTPAFDESTDSYFRNHDVTFKFAADASGLDAAQGVCIKEFSLSVANNARPNQCVGSSTPNDIFTLMTEISGNFVVDFEDPANYYDLFKASTKQAMRIEMERTDLPELGSGSGLYPKVQIDLHNVTFDGYSPDRPLDDIVTEGIDFMGHYDETDGEAITIVLQNEQTDYDAA
jgi:hypothetical protein